MVSAGKFFRDGTPCAGQQFDYSFDTIGNRTGTQAGGDQTGANLRQAAYTNNLLNQIMSRGAPGDVDVMGLALATNTVKVNGLAAYRKWEYFREQIAVNNTAAALWTNMTVSAPGQATTAGHVFVARNPESFTYDPDGNQTSDGRFTNQWDGENRLIRITSLTNAPVASMCSNVFTYDFMGRRIQKVVWTNSGSAWRVSCVNKFVYDGWNLAAILDGSNTNNVLYTFTWGTDLSGSMQGAGGVGGLVSMTVCTGANAGTYFPCYDGNGNVVAMVNAATGVISGNWEYDPFGGILRATGPLAFQTPFLFSTKFYDWETGLYYYGYRYYNPSTGRWLSRDPMHEQGGPNLYGFVDGDAVNGADDLGLLPFSALLAEVNRLNSMQLSVCDYCPRRANNHVGVTITGSTTPQVPPTSGGSSVGLGGDSVTITSQLDIQGYVTTIEYWWWDCASAQAEARGIFGLPSNWHDYGYSQGGPTYPRTDEGGGFWGADTFHWDFDCLVVYTYCGADGHNHATYRNSNELEYTWTRHGRGKNAWWYWAGLSRMASLTKEHPPYDNEANQFALRHSAPSRFGLSHHCR